MLLFVTNREGAFCASGPERWRAPTRGASSVPTSYAWLSLRLGARLGRHASSRFQNAIVKNAAVPGEEGEAMGPTGTYSFISTGPQRFCDGMVPCCFGPDRLERNPCVRLG